MVTPQVPATLFFFFMASAIILGIRCRSLVNKGLYPSDWRLSLWNLRRALDAATTDADKREVRRFRRWYIVHLILFWTGLITAFCAVSSAHR